MTTLEKQIEQARSGVLAFRYQTQDVYPWPSDKECLMFAIQELAEALSARMDEEGVFLRNNPDKGHDALSELGDAAFMLLSVRNLYPIHIESEFFSDDEYDLLLYALEDLASIAYREKFDVLARRVLTQICTYPEFDLLEGVQKTIAKQRSKHDL